MAPRPGLLDDEELAAWLADHPDWEVVASKLHRELHLGSFVEAFGLMAQVALVAERLDHHPEWRNVYSTVVIDLTTHDAGGLTSLDLQLAEAVDAAVPEQSPRSEA